MGWFSKKKSDDLSEARKKLNAKLDLIHSYYVEQVKVEQAPILPIIPVGSCWTEVIDGIQVSEPNFPYNKEVDTIFIINAQKGTKIGPHRHYEVEIIHVIRGSYKELVTGVVNAFGDTEKYDSLKPHGMEFLEDTIIIAHWKKVKNESTN